jgi:hypothetical protein
MRKIAQTDNEYVHDVPVSISGGLADGDISPSSRTTPIHFRIDIEARSWGIKGFTVTIIDTAVQIPVIVTRWTNNQDVEEDRTILVDLTKLRQNHIQSRGVVSLGEMEIVLEKDFSVNYIMSSIEILS